PSTVRPPSAGGLTSRRTSLPVGMVTLSPAAGTLRSGQVAASDQRVCLTAGDFPSWACTTATTLASRNAGRSDARRNERRGLLTALTPSEKGAIRDSRTRREHSRIPHPRSAPPAHPAPH